MSLLTSSRRTGKLRRPRERERKGGNGRLTRPAKPSGATVDSGDLEIFKYDLKSWREKKSALKRIPEKSSKLLTNHASTLSKTIQLRTPCYVI